MTSYAQAERIALTALLGDVGPDAPTLCEGWSTRDLAAHLVLRERRPDAAVGILVPAAAGYTERVQRSIRDGQSWTALVERVRSGPPALLRLLDDVVNVVELFVHHEDVRRARPGWAPRALDPREEDLLWSRTRLFARLARRRAPVGLVLDAPGYGTVTVRADEPRVTLRGAPGELLLFVSGRRDAARVEETGAAEAIERLRGATFSL